MTGVILRFTINKEEFLRLLSNHFGHFDSPSNEMRQVDWGASQSLSPHNSLAASDSRSSLSNLCLLHHEAHRPSPFRPRLCGPRRGLHAPRLEEAGAQGLCVRVHRRREADAVQALQVHLLGGRGAGGGEQWDCQSRQVRERQVRVVQVQQGWEVPHRQGSRPGCPGASKEEHHQHGCLPYRRGDQQQHQHRRKLDRRLDQQHGNERNGNQHDHALLSGGKRYATFAVDSSEAS